jgi:predicted phosphate transport protein (TIGR00153 family)
MLGWFHALMPREQRFFDLYAAHARTLVLAAEELRAMLEGGDAITDHCRAIVAHEQSADAITREVLKAVRRTFITPFDRGDIKDLISSMDDAIDQMQKTAKVITLFEVHEFEPEMRGIAGCILQCAQLVDDAVPLLSRIAEQAMRLNVLCEKIFRIEEEADRIHDHGLKKLYQRYRNDEALIFLARSDIYEHLEKVVDRFEDIADEITGIVIEHV